MLALERRLRGDARHAERLLRDAIEHADRAGARQRAAQARLSLVPVLADLGRLDDALTAADVAQPALRGVELGQLETQRALVLSRAGRYSEALRDYDRALRLLRPAGDPEWRCRVLSNRAAVLGYLGRYQAARNDLQLAHRLATSHGLDIYAFRTKHNLGFVELRAGDIPAALRSFGAAEQWLPRGSVEASTLLDVAEAYLTGRLFHEARQKLEEAITALAAGGFAVDLPEAQVLLARLHLLDKEPGAAVTVATDAAAKFRQQRRPGWTALAHHLALHARHNSGVTDQELLDQLRRSARELIRRGWAHAAVHSHVLAGELAHRLGRPRIARTELDRASQARLHGPIAVRAPAWYATALRRVVDDDTGGALRAARAGLRAVDEFATTLGATDLRVRASGWGEDLATLGIHLTRRSGDAWQYLTWVERWRANDLRRPPVRPPRDGRLAADLARLRKVTADLATSSARGERCPKLAAQQVKLERAIRDRSRTASGRAGRHTAARLDRAELGDRLGDRALVELTSYDGTILAVTFVDGRCRLHQLGTLAEATAEMDALRFALHRLARRHGSEQSLAAAEAAVRHAADRLDAMLLAPLRQQLGDRDVVLTPTGPLHALPWSALPHLRDRPLSVAPSATMWLSAARRPRRRTRLRGAVAIAGPGLEHSQREARMVARHHTGARQLTGRRATVAAVLGALDRADIAHIAAHGTFRSDNPQFSALDLADGPLTVYDLEHLEVAPRRLVLSSCDTALSAVHAGNELQGVAAAFFALGTSALVASVTPVTDDETHAVMTRFHKLLGAGVPPGRALADAGTSTGTLGFVCFGAG